MRASCGHSISPHESSYKLRNGKVVCKACIRGIAAKVKTTIVDHTKEGRGLNSYQQAVRDGTL